MCSLLTSAGQTLFRETARGPEGLQQNHRTGPPETTPETTAFLWYFSPLDDVITYPAGIRKPVVFATVCGSRHSEDSRSTEQSGAAVPGARRTAVEMKNSPLFLNPKMPFLDHLDTNCGLQIMQELKSKSTEQESWM